MLSRLAAFAVLSLVLTITPGPDSLLVLRSSLRLGRRAGVRVAVGATSGSFVWGLCSAAGLTLILSGAERIYSALQIAGAGYLVYQGIRGFRSCAGHGFARPARNPGFGTGLLSNLLNPKVGLFFLTVIPQLIPRHAQVTAYALAFVVIDALIACTWLTTVAWLSDRASAMLHGPRVGRALDRTASTVLVALGLRIAAKS